MGGSRQGCPGGVVRDIARREYEIIQDWTERATKKNERIVGAGYAERQIADTLSRIDKVKTEL